MAALVATSALLSACTTPRPGDAERAPVPTAPVDSTDLATEPAASPRSATSTQSKAENAYRSWLDALDRRDAEAACRLQHPERTIELRQDAILLDRAELGDPCVDFVALLWEDSDRGYLIDQVEVTQQTAEKALLAVGFLDQPGRVTVRLEFQRGAWRVRSEEPRSGEASSADTARWVQTWCQLDYLDSLDQIIDAMGEPTGEYTIADGGDPQLYWVSNQYDFRVFYDAPSEQVLDLIGDYDALEASDLAQLDCPELR